MSRLKTLLTQFHDIASNPRKQMDAYLAEGKKIVACAPIYTPEELVHAMGMVPMGVWGVNLELNESKRYFPSFVCSVMQSILEFGIQGGYKGISAIMIPSLCDSMKGLCENWKFAVPDVPFIAADYPQNRKIPAGFTYVKAVYQKQIEQLKAITGQEFSMDALKETNAVYNEHNQVMRTVSQVLADHPSVLASQRSDIFKSALFMRKEEHTALVKELIEVLAETPETQKKIRIMTTGIQTDHPDLLKILDENEMQIVADDVAQETRQYQTDAPDLADPLDAASQKFCDRDYCSVLYDIEKKRIQKIVETVKERKADGILYVQTKFCDPEEFDYVPLKQACEANDIPLLMVEVDRQMGSLEQVKTAVLTFSEILK